MLIQSITVLDNLGPWIARMGVGRRMLSTPNKSTPSMLFPMKPTTENMKENRKWTDVFRKYTMFTSVTAM